MKRNAILKLQTDQGLLEGHTACAAYLEESVEALLLKPAVLDQHAQRVLLEEVVPVFTASDNEKFLTPPTEEKVEKAVKDSNLYAAPGTDGIPSLLYKECWNVLGTPLTVCRILVNVLSFKNQ